MEASSASSFQGRKIQELGKVKLNMAVLNIIGFFSSGILCNPFCV